jgi:hypothetical protein
MPRDWSLINVATLTTIELDELVANVEVRECSAYSGELSEVAKEEGRWRADQLECLHFAEQVLEMMLQSGDSSEPYGPMLVILGKRSSIPADFPKENLVALEPWAMALKDPELKARFLDVLWLQTKSYRAAQCAVEAYVATALRLANPNDWPGCLERFERAARLATQLGKGSIDLKTMVLAEVENLVHLYGGVDSSYFCLKLIRLLIEFSYGDPREFARMALASADVAKNSRDFCRAKDHQQLAADCFRVANDAAAEAQASKQAAECLVLESEVALGQPGRGAMAAAKILSDAIQAMRQVHGGKERAAELHERLLAVQAQALTEFRLESTNFDGTELLQQALDAVRGKCLTDAIVVLCSMTRPQTVEKLIDEVHAAARVAILGNFFTSEVVNSRGRVVARIPGLEGGGRDITNPALRWRMFQTARIRRGVVVQAMLNHAVDEVAAEHAPNRQDIIDLIRYSPWIPPGHTESIARALLAGFHGDMLVAAHMVIPQLEALVRQVVDSNGGTTSMLDPMGVQQERPLSQLLETNEANQAFGADGVFEMQDLLIDPLGANLRNELAHGLMNDGSLFCSDVIYAWGLLLKFCVFSSIVVERRLGSVST